MSRYNVVAIGTGALLVAGASLFPRAQSEAPKHAAPVEMSAVAVSGETATAVFAGGCFWGIEAVFEHVKGVTDAVSGYAGGSVKDPSYQDVSSGKTGHAEVVRVTYDPKQVSYRQLLEIFFSVAHDPTQLNRQGPDVGTQYRSAIFYVDEEQAHAARGYIAQMEKAHTYARPIVTQVVPLEKFYMAEKYHQDYMVHHPNQPYIVYHDRPKVEKLRKQFPEMWRDR